MKDSVSIISKVLPKQTLRKYLFEFKVPLSYRNVVKLYNDAYNGTDIVSANSSLQVSSAQLMTLKRILETHRRRSGSLSKIAATIESNLVEQSAELGDNTAIALLCGSTLTDAFASSSTASPPQEDDVAHANKLLKQLMDMKFPLAFKISADLAYKMGHSAKAKEFYQLALDSGIGKSMANAHTLETDCLRSIALISFMDKDLVTAKKYFEQAIAASHDPKQVMDCHFYLAQILAYNPGPVRYHLERAAAQGLKEAFAPLAFLILSKFPEESNLALEWFRLGASINDFNCVVGLFDYCYKNGLRCEALSCLDKIRTSSSTPKDTLTAVMQKRQDAIKDLEADTIETGRWD